MIRFLTFASSITYPKISCKKLLATLISLFSSLLMSSHSYAEPSELTGDHNKKILIIYYSRSGNTDSVAQSLHTQIGGDLIRLETVTPYPEEYRATTIQAQNELANDFHPELKTQIDNISTYDMILIGSPMWWGTMSMPVRSFLYNYDLSGKQLALFITHEGSGLGRSVDDLKKFQPNATILPSIAIYASDIKNSQTKIQQWLTQIGLVK